MEELDVGGALLMAGVGILIYEFIWLYIWLEVIRDPKQELLQFYNEHPVVEYLVRIAKSIWWPMLFAGLSLVSGGYFMGGYL
ncbi:hypothetical protein [Thiomonas sp.]